MLSRTRRSLPAGHLVGAELGQHATASLDIAAVPDPRAAPRLGARTEGWFCWRPGVVEPGWRATWARSTRPSACGHRGAGQRGPADSGRPATTLLAFAPEAQVESVLKRRRERLARRHGDERGAAARPARDGRPARLGLSWRRPTTAPGVAGPVLADDGHAVASIGVAAPISRHNRRARAGHRQAVIETARTASRRLHARHSPAPDVQRASVTGSS